MSVRPNRRPLGQSTVLGGLRRHRRLLNLGTGRLAAICATGVGAGVVQALLLLVIVQAAAAVTAGDATIALDVGPLTEAAWAVDTAIIVGIGALLVLLALELANSALQAHLTARSVASTRRAMLAAYSVADHAEKTRHERGETSQLVFGMPGSAMGVAGAIATAVTGIANFVTLVASAVVISPVATGTSLVGFVLILGLLRPLTLLTQRLSNERSLEQRTLSSRQLERVELAAEISAFGVDRHVDARIDDGIGRIELFTRRIRFVGRASSVVYRVGVFAMILGMLAVLGRMADPDLATLTASMLLLLRSLSYGQTAQQAYQTMAEVMPVIDQIADARDRWTASSPDGSEPSDEPVGWRLDGLLRFDDVSFGYDAESEVLSNIGVEIRPGEFVAVIGPSGSGKSTFLHLLLRLRRPRTGSITVDAVPIDRIDVGAWRRSVAYVPQTPRLLSGTVRDAVRFGRDLDDAALRNAAVRAHIADDIDAWPNGWDTQLRDVGETLSGGQRQRLALARALAGSPSVLLLDEPTSALDPESERVVTATLESLKGSVTIIAIAHRLGTVRCADQVLVIDGGASHTTTVDELDIRDTSETIAA